MIPLAPLKALLKRLRPGRPSDIRARRFVAVIDCILNQNSRDAGAARFPAMNFELLQLCHEHHVGVLQMPCPEIAALGCKRARLPGLTIRDALDTTSGRQRCAEIAANVADRIEASLAEGDTLLAVLGGNAQSPGCAVHDGDARLLDSSGVFMKELQAAFRERNLEATFRGIRDDDPELLALDLQWFRELLSGPQE